MAALLWQQFGSYKVWAWHAPMGAGKTTCIHALCGLLGVEDAVSSPTYSIINHYRCADGTTLFHLDLYRLADEEEAVLAGVEDVLQQAGHCMVEWPEKIPGLLPPGTLHLELQLLPGGQRRILAPIGE